MTQIHTGRKSDNPYVETVWATQNVDDGVYVSTPDGSWDLIVLIQADGTKQMMVTGQATKPMDVPYQKDTSSVVISFAPSAYMPQYPGDTLLDSAEILPNVDADHFQLAGRVFAFPTFDSIETLVDELVTLGILKNDRVVDGLLRGKPIALSERAEQRHFVGTTGMTQKNLAQIQRAQKAVRLLQQGKRPSDVAADTGYTDQPHLAKSLKRIMRTKPSDVDDIHKL